MLLSCTNYLSLARPDKLPATVTAWTLGLCSHPAMVPNQQQEEENVARVGSEVQGGQKDRDGGNSSGN